MAWATWLARDDALTVNGVEVFVATLTKVAVRTECEIKVVRGNGKTVVFHKRDNSGDD